MAAAALLSVTLVPALMIVFVRGRIFPEQKNPLNRFLIWLYRPIIKAVLGAKTLTILLALTVVAITVWLTSQIGSEFMPTLNEGTLFYMPTTLPGISVTKAADLLQMQDRIIKSFPEVESVFGKAGRASTATDPAPTEMMETIVNLKPESEWPAFLEEQERLMAARTEAAKKGLPELAAKIRLPSGEIVDHYDGSYSLSETGKCASGNSSSGGCSSAPLTAAALRWYRLQDDCTTTYTLSFNGWESKPVVVTTSNGKATPDSIVFEMHADGKP